MDSKILQRKENMMMRCSKLISAGSQRRFSRIKLHGVLLTTTTLLSDFCKERDIVANKCTHMWLMVGRARHMVRFGEVQHLRYRIDGCLNASGPIASQ